MSRINFDLQQLQAFVAVADKGSFRAAADHIHLSAPALSRRIDRLEGILGARLFHRTTRAIELTALGRVFLERARPALDDLEAAMLSIGDIAASRTGRVSVACVPSAAISFLPSIVGPFSERHPLIRIRVMDETAGEVLASVLKGESDFGISFMGAQIPELDFAPIHTDAFVLAVPRSHGLAGRKSVAWVDLAAERLITVARSSGNRQLLDDALARAGINPVFTLEVNHIATLLGMVAAGLGLAAVPRLALPPTHPDLAAVDLKDPTVSRVLGIVRRRGGTLRTPAQAFHDHLHKALRVRR